MLVFTAYTLEAMAVYIQERHNWTVFQWEDQKMLNLLSEV